MIRHCKKYNKVCNVCNRGDGKLRVVCKRMAHKVKWKETKNGPEKTGYEMAHLDFCDDACSVYGHPYCLL